MGGADGEGDVMTRLESQAALHRFDVMLGHKRRLPAAAWRGIAVRLDVVAQIVPSAYAAKYRDRAREAWARWSAAQRPVVGVSYLDGRVVGMRFWEAA